MNELYMLKALDKLNTCIGKLNTIGAASKHDKLELESKRVLHLYMEATNLMEMCREEFNSLSDTSKNFEDIESVYIDGVNFYKAVTRGFVYKYCHLVVVADIEFYLDDGEVYDIQGVLLVKKLDDWLRALDLSYRYATSNIKEMTLIPKPIDIQDDIQSAIDMIDDNEGPEALKAFLVFYLQQLIEAFIVIEEWRVKNCG